MEPIKKILVTLDVAKAVNATIVQFASFIARSSSAQEVTFVNIIKNLNIPEEVKKEFPDMEKNALQERMDMVERSIQEHFHPEKQVKIEKIVKAGRPTKKIMALANEMGADLIIMGRKKDSTGSGLLAQRLARRASCNLLIIPEGAQPGYNKVLVPVDFSDYAKLALLQSIDIAEKYKGDTEIICQNVYNVPVGYHYTGKSYEEFSKVMKDNATANFKQFVQDIDTKGFTISEIYSLDQNDNLASDIKDFALKIKPDVIVFGAKGRTSAAALFIGSLAEKLISTEVDFPILVVRPKGKNAGIIEYIREI